MSVFLRKELGFSIKILTSFSDNWCTTFVSFDISKMWVHAGCDPNQAGWGRGAEQVKDHVTFGLLRIKMKLAQFSCSIQLYRQDHPPFRQEMPRDQSCGILGNHKLSRPIKLLMTSFPFRRIFLERRNSQRPSVLLITREQYEIHPPSYPIKKKERMNQKFWKQLFSKI